ncbi:Protein SMG7 [Smittium culicis]|uniref:Protein SMG7 n=1 Tax=Smittium culicis TaxID=133412 RepID=A0A1R1XI65_9FUNG|nr:Protein SMG7 [Smittium culicis]
MINNIQYNDKLNGPSPNNQNNHHTTPNDHTSSTNSPTSDAHNYEDICTNLNRKAKSKESEFELLVSNLDTYNIRASKLLRNELAQIYSEIITLSPEFCSKNNVTQRLWRYYVYIEFSKARKNLELTYRQNNPDAIDEIKYKLHMFLQTSTGFYLELLLRLKLLAFDFKNTHIPIDLDSSISYFDLNKYLEFPQKSQLINLIQSIMFNIGDLYRYMAMYCDLDIHISPLIDKDIPHTSKNSYLIAEYSLHSVCWITSRKYYENSIIINPSVGLPYNQLGVIYGTSNNVLQSVYYYLRALTCNSPFITAKGNLYTQLNTFIKYYNNRQSNLNPKTVSLKNNTSLPPNQPKSDLQNSNLENPLISFTQEYISLILTILKDKSSPENLLYLSNSWPTLLENAIKSLLLSPIEITLISVSVFSIVSIKLNEYISIISHKDANNNPESIDINGKFDSLSFIYLSTLLALFKSLNITKIDSKFLNSNSLESILNNIQINPSQPESISTLSPIPSLMIGTYTLVSLISFISSKVPSKLISISQIAIKIGLVNELISSSSDELHNINFELTNSISLDLYYRFGALSLDGWTVFNSSSFGFIPQLDDYSFSNTQTLNYSLINCLDSVTCFFDAAKAPDSKPELQPQLKSLKQDKSRNYSKLPSNSNYSDAAKNNTPNRNNKPKSNFNNKSSSTVKTQSPIQASKSSQKVSNLYLTNQNKVYHIKSLGFISKTCRYICQLLEINIEPKSSHSSPKLYLNSLSPELFSNDRLKNFEDNGSSYSANSAILQPRRDFSTDRHRQVPGAGAISSVNSRDVSDQFQPHIGLSNSELSDDEDEVIVFTAKKKPFY